MTETAVHFQIKATWQVKRNHPYRVFRWQNKFCKRKISWIYKRCGNIHLRYLLLKWTAVCLFAVIYITMSKKLKSFLWTIGFSENEFFIRQWIENGKYRADCQHTSCEYHIPPMKSYCQGYFVLVHIRIYI